MKYYILNALLAVIFTASVTSCALHDGGSGELSETTAALAICCSSGYYRCPTASNPDLEFFDYDPPRCGVWTRPRAKDECERSCSVTCLDSGWVQSC